MKDEIEKIISKPKAKRILHWNEVRKKMFLEAYMRNGGNCNATGRELGISRIMVYKYRDRWVL